MAQHFFDASTGTEVPQIHGQVFACDQQTIASVSMCRVEGGVDRSTGG